jgi:hypothetical protein
VQLVKLALNAVMQNDKDIMEAIHLYPLNSALGDSRSDMHSEEETNISACDGIRTRDIQPVPCQDIIQTVRWTPVMTTTAEDNIEIG